MPCIHDCISVVSNLESYERLKLHILNLGHTILADIWKKQNRSVNETVYEILNDNRVYNYLNKIYFDEILPTFTSAGLQNEAINYIETTLERLKNPFLKHRLKDIAQNHQEKVFRRIQSFLIWSDSLESHTNFNELKRIVF